jgi:succinate dehydrogenase / fumarate reductase, cytochrome b subunit
VAARIIEDAAVFTARRDDGVRPVHRHHPIGSTSDLYRRTPRQQQRSGEVRMYRGQSGQWSWLLHRVTGMGVLLFLLVHIVDITLLGFGPTIYNDAINVFSLWPIRLASLALIGSVLYHAFNGARIILIDFWASGYKYQQAMFYIVLGLTIVSFIPMAYYVLAPIFHVCPQHNCAPAIM